MSLLHILLGLLLSLAPYVAIVSSSSHFPTPKRNPNPIIIPQLSRDAAIYSSTDSQFVTQSARWSSSSAPSFSHVFVPANEHDVVLMVGAQIMSHPGQLFSGLTEFSDLGIA